MVPNQETSAVVIGCGPNTGDLMVLLPSGVSAIVSPFSCVSTDRPDPPKLAIQDPEPPATKKSWQKTQRDLPKFLRPKREY